MLDLRGRIPTRSLAPGGPDHRDFVATVLLRAPGAVLEDLLWESVDAHRLEFEPLEEPRRPLGIAGEDPRDLGFPPHFGTTPSTLPGGLRDVPAGWRPVLHRHSRSRRSRPRSASISSAHLRVRIRRAWRRDASRPWEIASPRRRCRHPQSFPAGPDPRFHRREAPPRRHEQEGFVPR